MKITRKIIFIAAINMVSLAGSACPMCQAGATKKTQKAYEETTAILALLPILGGGGIFYWLYSKARKCGE